MIDYLYTVRTVDGRKYMFQCGNRQLDSVYRGIMNKECIEVTKCTNDTIVLINTKHIVSIEKW
ncbi:hypothetical protein KQUDLBSD_CDS0198 [Staphylococcus phage PG-2021_40]